MLVREREHEDNIEASTAHFAHFAHFASLPLWHMKVVVFGSGSFGTAMAAAVARNGHHVVILTRRDEVMKGINHKRHNPLHLKEF